MLSKAKKFPQEKYLSKRTSKDTKFLKTMDLEQKLDNHEEVPSFKVQRLTYATSSPVGHVEEHMHIIEWACLALMDSMSYFLK